MEPTPEEQEWLRLHIAADSDEVQGTATVAPSMRPRCRLYSRRRLASLIVALLAGTALLAARPWASTFRPFEMLGTHGGRADGQIQSKLSIYSDGESYGEEARGLGTFMGVSMSDPEVQEIEAKIKRRYLNAVLQAAHKTCHQEQEVGSGIVEDLCKYEVAFQVPHHHWPANFTSAIASKFSEAAIQKVIGIYKGDAADGGISNIFYVDFTDAGQQFKAMITNMYDIYMLQVQITMGPIQTPEAVKEKILARYPDAVIRQVQGCKYRYLPQSGPGQYGHHYPRTGARVAGGRRDRNAPPGVPGLEFDSCEAVFDAKGEAWRTDVKVEVVNHKTHFRLGNKHEKAVAGTPHAWFEGEAEQPQEAATTDSEVVVTTKPPADELSCPGGAPFLQDTNAVGSDAVNMGPNKNQPFQANIQTACACSQLCHELEGSPYFSYELAKKECWCKKDELNRQTLLGWVSGQSQ